MIENSQYRTNEWQEKRSHIIHRDNYSCQICETFNPSEGLVTVFNEQDKDIELHQYNSETSVYSITSQNKGINISLDFGWGTWLITPILQVHHKKYIDGRLPWEYEDDDLITFCNECHNSGHQSIKIPVYNSHLKLIDKKLFKPENNNTSRTHNYKPWVFVNKHTGNYELSSANPTLDFHLAEDQLEQREEHAITAFELYQSFMRRFLPDYKMEKI